MVTTPALSRLRSLVFLECCSKIRFRKMLTEVGSTTGMNVRVRASALGLLAGALLFRANGLRVVVGDGGLHGSLLGSYVSDASFYEPPLIEPRASP